VLEPGDRLVRIVVEPILDGPLDGCRCSPQSRRAAQDSGPQSAVDMAGVHLGTGPRPGLRLCASPRIRGGRPMAMSAAAALPPLPEPTGRSFALLDEAERARLAAVLRPLAWIDGLITAAILSPEEEPEDWIEHVWNGEREDDIEQLSLAQSNDLLSAVVDQYCHVSEMLFERPEQHCPYLSGCSDRMEAAAQWAAGFRFGIRLQPEAWEPFIENDDARSLLAAILSLERDEGLSDKDRTDSPFREMPTDQRAHLRRTAIDMLPDIVLSLHAYSVSLDVEAAGAEG
jgi:yecA family protein